MCQWFLILCMSMFCVKVHNYFPVSSCVLLSLCVTVESCQWLLSLSLCYCLVFLLVISLSSFTSTKLPSYYFLNCFLTKSQRSMTHVYSQFSWSSLGFSLILWSFLNKPFYLFSSRWTSQKYVVIISKLHIVKRIKTHVWQGMVG